MPSRRYTLRLPRALDAAVQAHLDATHIPFAALMRDALSAYLADTPLTPGAPTGADTRTEGDPAIARMQALRAQGVQPGADRGDPHAGRRSHAERQTLA
jgi:hypothetical protein